MTTARVERLPAITGPSAQKAVLVTAFSIARVAYLGQAQRQATRCTPNVVERVDAVSKTAKSCRSRMGVRVV